MSLTGYAKREIIIICLIGLILVAVSVRLILEAALITGFICLTVSPAEKFIRLEVQVGSLILT